MNIGFFNVPIYNSSALFSISSNRFFSDLTYNGKPMAKKRYSFLKTVTSSKIWYKLGTMISNETRIPIHGFSLIVRSCFKINPIQQIV